MTTKSGPERLSELLRQNAYGPGLTEQEMADAYKLVEELPLGDKDCWVCCSEDKRKAIRDFDQNLCPGHVVYALATRK